MARIVFGFGISSISGKVGGSVFAKSAAGFVLKNKTRGKKFASVSAGAVRVRLAAVQNAWSGLTDEQRKIWTAYTAFSPTQIKRSKEQFLSGHQLFLKYNSYRLAYQQAILSVPDFSSCGVVSVAFSILLFGGVLYLVASRAADPTVEFFMVSITPPVKCTLTNPGSRLRQMYFATTVATNFDISASYIAAFGALPTAGQTIFYKASVVQFLTPEVDHVSEVSQVI